MTTIKPAKNLKNKYVLYHSSMDNTISYLVKVKQVVEIESFGMAAIVVHPHFKTEDIIELNTGESFHANLESLKGGALIADATMKLCEWKKYRAAWEEVQKKIATSNWNPDFTTPTLENVKESVISLAKLNKCNTVAEYAKVNKFYKNLLPTIETNEQLFEMFKQRGVEACY